jgi:hypothetical protein
LSAVPAVLAKPWAQAITTGLLALLAAGLGLRIWLADLAIPFAYGIDARLYLMYSKSVHDHGWLLENGSLAAPIGLRMYDYPEGGTINWLLFRVFDLLTGNYVVAHNLLYLASFPLAAIAAWWALRHLSVAPPLAVALAVLYAVVPYHFARGETHLILSLYYGLPPVLACAVAIAQGRSPIPLGRHGMSRRTWLARAGPPLLAAILAGLMSAYYVVFAVIIIVAAGVFGWLRTGRARLLASTGLLVVVVAAATAAQFAPSIAYRLANGSNGDVATRPPGAVENYPLKPLDLILPVAGHPIGPLAELRDRYGAFRSSSNPGLALGTVGSLGLLGALAGLVIAAAGRGRRWPATRRWAVARLAAIGWLCAAALGVSVLGGAASLVSLFVGPYLRSWDRVAIVIALLALAAFGVIATSLLRRAGSGRRRALALLGAAAIVFVGGAFDQLATSRGVPAYAEIRQRWQADERLIASVEGALPPGGMVYQLPFMPWPEERLGLVESNEDLRPYLHSRSLRWSGAALAGREPGWRPITTVADVGRRVELLRLLGFNGIFIDWQGYPRDGPEMTAAGMASALEAAIGQPTVESDDGRYALYVIPAGQASATRAGDAQDPIWLRQDHGWGGRTYLRGEHTRRAMRAEATVELRNNRASAREVVARFTLEPRLASPATLQLGWPDGVTEELQLAGGQVEHSRQFTLPAGTHQVTLRVVGQPQRRITATMLDLAVVDASLAELLP